MCVKIFNFFYCSQSKKLEKQIQQLNSEILSLRKEIVEKTSKNNKYKEQCLGLKREIEHLKKKNFTYDFGIPR